MPKITHRAMAAKLVDPQEAEFIKQYIKTGNITESAARLGYNDRAYAHKVGRRILERENVQKAMELIAQDSLERAKASIDWKVEKLKQVIEACEFGRTNDKGLFDAANLTRAVAELNKMFGHYAPEKHVTVNLMDDVRKALPNYEQDY